MMKSLKGPDGPLEITVLDGIVLTVKPRTWFDFTLARLSAQRIVADLEKSAATCLQAGILPDGTAVDLSNEDYKGTLLETILIQELAILVITGWAGIVDQNDQPMPINEENIRRVMNIWPPQASHSIGDLFFRKYMAKHAEFVQAKKDSATDANGTTPPAAVANTAKDAGKPASPAPGDNPAKAGSFARMWLTRLKRGKKSSPGTSSNPSKGSTA